MNKNLKTALWIGLPLLAGVAIIFWVNRRRKSDMSAAPDTVPESNESASTLVVNDPSVFPLKAGSNGQIVEKLQKALMSAYGASTLPKYGADGDWGSETTNAMKNNLGITSITSQDQYNSVIAKLQAITNAANNSTRAGVLVSQWQANPSLKLMGGLTGAFIDQYVEDYAGALNSTGKRLFLGSNTKYDRSEYELTAVSKNGFVLLKKLTGHNGPAGTYKANANEITVG